MKDYFSLAFSNIKRRKVRSWLTMIGIFIGIAAVVGLISLGQGMQNVVVEQFQNLGSNKIIIMPSGFGSAGQSVSGSLMLTSKDLKIIEDISGVKWAVGILFRQGVLSYRDENSVNYIIGISPEDIETLSEIQGIEIEDGRNLKSGEQNSVIVGYNHIYGDIWEKNLDIGKTIIIENREFKIVGVFSKVGNNIDDSQIYLPKEIMKEVYNTGEEESQILAETDSDAEPSKVAERIKEDLRKERGEKEGEETFSVQTSEQLLESFSNIFAVVQGVLIGIAAISLIVGGIGIMNTMYTSVLERTKEIGTMKAVGAKNSDILLIFLFESGLLGLIGGMIGILIGIGLGKGAEYIASIALNTNLLRADFSLFLIIGALSFSFLIGALSGILPAIQAAKLKPADALRYE